jgi:hypothetical protein
MPTDQIQYGEPATIDGTRLAFARSPLTHDYYVSVNPSLEAETVAAAHEDGELVLRHSCGLAMFRLGWIVDDLAEVRRISDLLDGLPSIK